ncbi:hypothetical protein BDV93DRAFT_572014 [Ceratobasidium sp. AG-I]|nr:hypothetical protein BDV93DRAFT_572014 [Ceratobasidium sp. AG-I]
MLRFDYPLTSPYPWRFASLMIIGLSLVTLASLIYINLATVGMTSYAFHSSKFAPQKNLSPLDQLNIRSMENYTIGCTSGSLVAGGTYQTLNGAFTYTIKSIYDQISQAHTSNANYSGTTLSNCAVDAITVTASYVTSEAIFEATVNCSLFGSLEVIATTNTVVSMPAEHTAEVIDNRLSNLARDGSRLISEVGSDFFYEALFIYASKRDPETNITQEMRSLSFLLRLHHNSTIEVLSGSRLVTTHKMYDAGNLNALREVALPQSPVALENYLRIMSSAILSDLGVASQPNIMTSTDLFKSFIRPVNFQHDGNESNSAGTTSKINTILADMSSYNLPFASIEPTEFSALYLCYRRNWKTSANLVMDVCVATTSLFLAFWGTMRVILGLFARRTSAKSNHVTCHACSDAQSTLQDQEKLFGEKVWLMEPESVCEGRSESSSP